MIGEKLGKYTILESIGAGSMGTVYKAEDPDGRIVALKLVRSQVLYDMERRERFLQGILAASLIRHPGICPILEIGDDNDDFFIVMPFQEGNRLDQYLDRKPLSWQAALDIVIPTAEALCAAHTAGTVHRGVKPSNIWINRDGAVVLSDCCVVRFTEIAKQSRTRSGEPRTDFAETLIPLGALCYMSPEQVRGDDVDARSDVFSLAATLYEMLTGRHPFDARNSLSRLSAILEADPPPLSSKQHPVPSDLNRIVLKALARRPDDRYGSMEEFLADLLTLRRNAVHDQTDLPATTRRRPLRTWLWVAAVLLMVSLVLGTIGLLHRS